MILVILLLVPLMDLVRVTSIFDHTYFLILGFYPSKSIYDLCTSPAHKYPRCWLNWAIQGEHDLSRENLRSSPYNTALWP